MEYVLKGVLQKHLTSEQSVLHTSDILAGDSEKAMVNFRYLPKGFFMPVCVIIIIVFN